MNARLLTPPHDVWVSVKKSFDRGSAAQVQGLFLDALARAQQR